ncbi:S8 family peptidase [Pseudomonas aeruginosa]|uniref:S8 family peptidase n=1 Tax=Pseudomonas aeruginosa TaxID=287 RepID=UPI003BF1B3E6
MAHYDHLRLIRLPTELPRRRKPGFGSPVPRSPKEHSARLTDELLKAVDQQVARKRTGIVDPSLILRVRMTEGLLEQGWHNVGLELLSSDPDKTLVLFSSSGDLAHFRRQLAAFGGDIPDGQKNPPYAGFISGIESIGAVEPRDRLGIRLREEGFGDLNDIDPDAQMLLDLEIWNIGAAQIRGAKLDDLTELIEQQGGTVYDRYNGPAISLLRIEVSGRLLINLLSIEVVAVIDLPPQPDTFTRDALELNLTDFPAVSILENAPVIGILDSGVNAHPLLEGVIVGAIGVPENLGAADEFGHGTRVAGVAAFGDLRAQLAGGGDLVCAARICSARVVNHRGGFDDHSLITNQMRDALTTLNRDFGCRIFSISLADIKSAPYAGGKVGPWTATLDELARELDVLILVSAGNRMPRQGERQEESITGYPEYLLEPSNRFLEPAAALNVLTVGSIAHGNGIDQALQDAGVGIQPITGSYEPSPFSRAGPGIGGAIKPDLVDLGGTLVYDPLAGPRTGYDQPSAGILTLNHRYLEQMLRTASGTSYSTPMVAHKAAQLLGRFPDASANLLRALLVGAAAVPEQAKQRLIHLAPEATRHICGNGFIGVERAMYSGDARVVMYAEDTLPLDNFAVFEIPIPEPYLNQPGDRTITVTLAYDPPVRHTRVDYAGVHMSYRVLRGVSLNQVVEHFRWRSRDEGAAPQIAASKVCNMSPGPTLREKGTVQTSCVTFKRGELAQYGDTYYLVVRCESGWAEFLTEQRYAVVVEIAHQAGVQIYQHIEQRVRVRPRILA